MKLKLKLKTLLLLCLLCNSIKSEEKLSSDLKCLDWFPEPVSYKLAVSHSQLAHKFEIIDDFVWDRNEDTFKEVITKHVVGTLNGGDSGYSDIVSIVFRQLPAVRQLTIAVFCIILSVITFLIIWKLGLSEIIEAIGCRFRFDEYRSGLTIIPIFCVLGLLILAANLRESTNIAKMGRARLETANDKSFMPIKERVQKKIAIVPCLFKRDFANTGLQKRYIDHFLDETINSSLLDTNLKLSKIKEYVTPSKACKRRANSRLETVIELKKDLVFDELLTESINLESEYVRIILEGLNTSLPIFAKALGTIEEFVEKYHKNVLLLPSETILDLYQTSASIMVIIAIITSTSLTVLMILKFEFKKNYSKRIAELSVPFSILFTVICLFLFIALITRISFIVAIHEEVQQDRFRLFRNANTLNISENGQNYKINYGDVLWKATKEATTLFSLLAEDRHQQVPEAVRGETIFKSTRKFNETIGKFMETFNGYEKYVEDSCEKSTMVLDKIERELASGSCNEMKIWNYLLEKVNKTKIDACNFSQFIKKSPIDNKKINESAFETWKKVLLPKEKSAVVRRKSIQDVQSPMQVYLVFENPSKKLRPTILEHMLEMSVLIAAMGAIHFVLALYFMCILPLLIDYSTTDEQETTSGYKKLSSEQSRSEPKTSKEK